MNGALKVRVNTDSNIEASPLAAALSERSAFEEVKIEEVDPKAAEQAERKKNEQKAKALKEKKLACAAK